MGAFGREDQRNRRLTSGGSESRNDHAEEVVVVRGPTGNLYRNGFWFLLGLKWFLMRLGVNEWGYVE